MNFRLTAILAAVAAVLGLLILFWDRNDDSERTRLELARRAFRFDPARVERVIIETGDLRIECQRHDTRWLLVHPIVSRADPVTIERLLGALQELPRSDIIIPPRRVADPYAPYGLDDPRARIGLVTGIATNTILVGRRTPLGDGVFVRQHDHPGLARVPTTLLDLLPAGADALRDRSLLEGSAGAITRLDIRGPSGYIQLARDAGGDWRLYQPFTARADSATVGALIEQLLACTITHFVQDAVGDLAPYGLDNSTAVTALLNTDSGAGSQMLSFGDTLPNAATLVYARLQAESSVYAVPQAARQALLVRPEDLRDRRIPALPPDAIQRIRVEENGATLELARDPAGDWQLLTPVRAPANPEAIDALLRYWADTRLVAFEDPASAAPEPAPVPAANSAPEPLPPLARHIRIDPRDDKLPPILLRVGAHPADSSQVRVAIEGDTAIAAATPARLLEFPLDPLDYRSRDILTIPAADLTALTIAHANQTHHYERDPATGAWTPDAPWLARLLPVVAPLRADVLLQPGAAIFDPALRLTFHLGGKTGLATTLLIGDELTPGGPRLAAIRGRDIGFALSPATVAALTPPPPPDTP